MDMRQIFSTVLNMSLTGSVAICFVLLARLALRKVPKIFSYCLWAVVLFRLLSPVSISSVFSVMNFARAPQVVSHGTVSSMNYAPVDYYLDIPILDVPEPEVQEETPQYHQNVNTSIPENRPDTTPTPDAGSQQATAEPVRDPIRYAVIIWFVGMGAMLIYNVISSIRLFGQLTGAVKLRKNIYIGDHVPTPFVLGFVKPRIYLPSTIDVSERRYIIAHERTHIKRGDHIVRLLAYLALCLHWFNPLVWLAFSLSGKDMEMSCDEAVIRMYGPRIRAEYSASLLRLATGRRSFALTPLAFGEGDTKGRVMNMAKWKKPHNGATILALILSIAVLAACGMNPTQDGEPTQDSTDIVQTEPVETTVFLWDDDTDAEEICLEAIEKLVQAESYYLDYRYVGSYDSGGIDYRRYGRNIAIVQHGELPGGQLYYDGYCARYPGDYWVWQDNPEPDLDPNKWLVDRWSPEDKDIKGWTVGPNTISFSAKWGHQIYEDQYYEGTFTYGFRSDGTLEYIQREYSLYAQMQPATATVDKLNVMTEAPEDTEAAIRAIAEQCLTREKVERLRSEQDAITEIPSNKTDYDRDYELGASRMGWEFFSDTWMFRLGTEDVTSTSATIVHCESNSGHSALVAGNAFWLEELVDGKWQYVDVMKQSVTTEAHSIDVSWDREDTFVLDWSDSYGELEPGYYRIGRYYTVTLENGNSETRPCYAKFRLHDPNQEIFLRICRDGMENLLNGNYHIRTYQLIESDIFDCFRTEEWKYGNDRMSRSEDVLSDGSPRLRGAILRDGEGYELTWENHDVTKPVIMWERLHYMSETNFLMWSYDFELYDSMIDKVTKEGNTITVWMKNRDDSSHDRKRISFTFDEDGNLQSAVRTLMQEDGSTKIANSIEVLDTAESEIKKLIESQDVSKPMPFFYADDVTAYPDAQKSGFENTTPQKVTSMADALVLADAECTMKVMDDRTGERYNIVQVFYDEDAGIWKVCLTYSQNPDGNQIIYLNNQGITQMIVTE